MIISQLAEWRPRLYHLLPPSAETSVARNGLLTVGQVLRSASDENGLVRWQEGNLGNPWQQSQWRELNRRLRDRHLHVQWEGEVIALRDQHSLGGINGLEALRSYLDDGLNPEDWIEILNSRVFLYPCQSPNNKRLCDKGQKFRDRYPGIQILTIDTDGIPPGLQARLELSTINGGAINGRARRGNATYVPLARYAANQVNKIYEVTVRNGITAEELRACCLSSWFLNRIAPPAQ